MKNPVGFLLERCHWEFRVWRISTELMMVNHHLDFEFIGLSDFFTISWDEAGILADTRGEMVLRIVSAEQLLLVPQTILYWE